MSLKRLFASRAWVAGSALLILFGGVGRAMAEEVIDDQPASFGAGEVRTVSSGAAIGGDYATMPTRSEAASHFVTWRAVLEESPYEVWVHLPPASLRHLAIRTSAARYEVSHRAGVTAVTVDQQRRAGWVRLGAWAFAAGDATVALSNGTGEPDGWHQVVVDAVKWVRLHDEGRILGDRSSDGSAPGYPALRMRDSSYEWLSFWAQHGDEDWIQSDFRWRVGSRVSLWAAAVIAYPRQPSWHFTEPERIEAWVDWNGDQQWSEGERVLSGTIATGANLGQWQRHPEEGASYLALSRDLVVPTDAKAGETWMRVRLAYGEGAGGPDRPADFGQVIDLKIILDPMPDDARSALLVAPLLDHPDLSRAAGFDPLLGSLLDQGYAVDMLAGETATIPTLVESLQLGRYRVLYFGTESSAVDGALAIEVVPSEAAARARLAALAEVGFETGPGDPEVVARALGTPGGGTQAWALCITPAFIYNHVPRLWDALVLCDGFPAFTPEAEPLLQALLDQGAYLVAGWKEPVSDVAAQEILAQLLARLGAGQSWEESVTEVAPTPLDMPGALSVGGPATFGEALGFAPLAHGDFRLTLGGDQTTFSD